MTPSPATLRGNENGRFPGQTMQAGGPDVPRVGVTSAGAGGNGEGKNRRMMDQLRGGNDAPGSPSFSPNPAASTSSNPFGSSLLSPIPDRSDTFNNFDDASSSSSSRAGSPEPGEGDSPSLVVPTALSEAISAFTTAGQRRADGRRGGLADQGFDVPSSRRGPGASGSSSPELAQKSPETARSGKVALNPHEYPDTPAFREVDDVLRKVRDEWPELVRGTSLAGQADGQEDEGDFDPVSLALHLLEPARRGSAAERDPPRSANGTRQTLPSFLRLKGQLDHAIRSTLSPQLNPTSSGNAYRAYESAITTHNATLGALTNAQKMIAGMRTGLGSTREKLEGTGREGLAGMYARMGMLEEMGGMLDEMCVLSARSLVRQLTLTFSDSDSLMRLPPSLEALLAEKRFLGAVVLLVRSIKALHKPEMLEIGALSDLRAWAVAQEGVSSASLRRSGNTLLTGHARRSSSRSSSRSCTTTSTSSPSTATCDGRVMRAGRLSVRSPIRAPFSPTDLCLHAVPLVDFGEDAEPTPSATASREPNTSFQAHSSGRSTARLPRLSKLQRFLQNLALKPSGADPALDEAFEDLLLDPADAADGDDGLGGSLSLGAGEGLDGFGASAAPSSTKARREAHKRRNPELDSFTYIEMLIESLAALGKLGYALDAVGQRVQGEMFALVEATIEEVEERYV